MTLRLVAISRRLSDAVSALSFGPPVTHVYNPLAYARAPHEEYLRRYGHGRGRVLLLGMNPGPYGMAQTGVPFGHVGLVRTFLGVDIDRPDAIGRPEEEHPKRPVEGGACRRSEVSGERLWGWARDRFGTAERFFARFFVLNYCPLVFMRASGANIVPEDLPADERTRLCPPCDAAVRDAVETLRPRVVVGVGAFAERQARAALAGTEVPVGRILHPSPASPAANGGWAEIAEQQLRALGISLV